MFSRVRAKSKTNDLKIKNEDLLLVLLFLLKKRSFKLISEGDLQKIIYFLEDELFSYNFLEKPIIYSYELLNEIQNANNRGFIDSVINIIGDESFPKYNYSLSLIGEARSGKIFESLPKNVQDRLNERIDGAINKINK